MPLATLDIQVDLHAGQRRHWYLRNGVRHAVRHAAHVHSIPVRRHDATGPAGARFWQRLGHRICPSERPFKLG